MNKHDITNLKEKIRRFKFECEWKYPIRCAFIVAFVLSILITWGAS